jgi:small subunit ribosomal protein S7
MPRRRVAAKRQILPDPKFHSERLARFINVIMLSGKKSIAEKVVYDALEDVVKKMGGKLVVEVSDEDEGGSTGDGTHRARILKAFELALDNVRPSVEVRSRRVGGATYQIPCEVREKRSIALGMRWIVQAARSRSEKGMQSRLASEFMDAIEGRGSSVKKREDTHRMAKANQAFAHFRWN